MQRALQPYLLRVLSIATAAGAARALQALSRHEHHPESSEKNMRATCARRAQYTLENGKAKPGKLSTTLRMNSANTGQHLGQIKSPGTKPYRPQDDLDQKPCEIVLPVFPKPNYLSSAKCYKMSVVVHVCMLCIPSASSQGATREPKGKMPCAQTITVTVKYQSPNNKASVR